jgi:hypothetical protein
MLRDKEQDGKGEREVGGEDDDVLVLGEWLGCDPLHTGHARHYYNVREATTDPPKAI